MTEVTETYIKAAIAGDKTISDSVGRKVLSILSGKAVAEIATDELKTREETAKMLKVCAVTVTNWGKRGIIHAVRIKGRRKAVGYSLNSILAFINGQGKDEVRG